jgi:hypothetical protein
MQKAQEEHTTRPIPIKDKTERDGITEREREKPSLPQLKAPPPPSLALQAQELVRRRTGIEVKPIDLAVAAPQADVVEAADGQAVAAILIAQAVRRAGGAAVVARVHEAALFPAHEDVLVVELAELCAGEQEAGELVCCC